MSRTFTPFAEQDPETKALVNELLCLKGNVLGYQKHMRQLGNHLADSLIPQLNAEHPKDICVICTVEDADFLARGLIEKLESCSFGFNTRMICMWNKRIRGEGISISPILRSYEEIYDKNDVVFVIVKSIISGACVVRTNLTRTVSVANPKSIFVVSPVMLKDAEIRLANEFPLEISRKFKFIHFATDTDRTPNGEEVIPGVGGSVYELLGFRDENNKNKYIPEIVRERRRKAYPDIVTA